MIQSDVTTPDKSGPGSDGKNGYTTISNAPKLLEPHYDIV